MANTEAFKKAVLAKGLKYGFLANSIGISRASLWMKINNTSEFRASEISELSKVMNLTAEEMMIIFFT